MGLSHVFSPDGLNSTLLSQVDDLEMAPAMGTEGRMYISGTGKGVKSLRLPRSSSVVNQRSHSLSDLFP